MLSQWLSARGGGGWGGEEGEGGVSGGLETSSRFWHARRRKVQLAEKLAGLVAGLAVVTGSDMPLPSHPGSYWKMMRAEGQGAAVAEWLRRLV